MKCPNCQAIIGSPRKHSEQFTTSYRCRSCNEESVIWEGVKVGDYVIESGHYRFYCNPSKNEAILQQLYMDIETDTSIIYRWYDLVPLPGIPNNLNEDTVEDKLKLYLLFL